MTAAAREEVQIDEWRGPDFEWNPAREATFEVALVEREGSPGAAHVIVGARDTSLSNARRLASAINRACDEAEARGLR